MIPDSQRTASGVVARGVALAYGTRRVLDDVSFTVPPGSSVAVIGPNGSGKSTLLRALAGLITPTAGSLDVPARARRAGVAFVLQNTTLEATMAITVRETVAIARYGDRRLLGRFTARDRELVASSLRRLGVADLANRPLQELSGGQRQRALVAQGLAQDAELLLLDEPFTGLDVVSRDLIGAAVAAERDAGRTVFVTTHELADARRADLVLLLAGRLVAAGSPAEVLVPSVLQEAYGERVMQLAGGEVFVDDPHHHDHDHDPAREHPGR